MDILGKKVLWQEESNYKYAKTWGCLVRQKTFRMGWVRGRVEADEEDDIVEL